MTGTAVKKKRFEGLIQFQEPLRQAMVCIQAAEGPRFATAFQSNFLKTLNTPDLSHFILTSDRSDVGEISSKVELRHLLMTVEQLEDDQVDWKQPLPSPDAKISSWLNSGDPLVCQYLFTMLAAAASDANSFDLGDLAAAGSLKSSFKDSINKAWMRGDRSKLFEDFSTDAEKFFKAEKQWVMTDGCTVSLLIEGPTKLDAASAFAAAIKYLKNPSRHLVSVNYIGGLNPRLQCVYLTPMRLPLKELQTSALKGFVLLRDIKETAQLAKSVLAS